MSAAAYAVLFPGQGSQAVGMGAGAIRAYPEAALAMERADRIIPGLSTLCREGPEDVLRRTEVTQPAVLAVSVALWEAWRARAGREPAAAAGHSLGEYTALVAAGALSLADALRLTRLRGELMEQALPGGRGGMGAVMGLDDGRVRQTCENVDAAWRSQHSGEAWPHAVVVAANFNAPGQVVVSGLNEALDWVRQEVAKSGGRYTPLSVSGPFHSPFMAPAAERFVPHLQAVAFEGFRWPVVANVTAAPHAPDAEGLRRCLGDQITRPVLWAQSLRRLAGMGIRHFVEIGPGRALTGMVRRTLPDAAALAVQDAESLEAALARLKGDGVV